MVKSTMGVGRGGGWRNLLIAACAAIATLWTTAANATITQGDFSVFGFFESREGGRWGEGQANGSNFPSVITPGVPVSTIHYGFPGAQRGGSFDFNHWDLVEMRQLADIRPDYHMVKNYKFLGRLDTLVLKDADFFAFYRPWYNAFGDLKGFGVAQPDRDFLEYNHGDKQHEYFQDTLREYYAQLNFTDNFSMRIGKQQVIWSEADALSGTELTNSSDLSYHWTHFESAENLRKNIRMIKFNYILPDFLKTANNEAEAFVIPGDYQGNGAVIQGDIRNPYVLRLPLSSWQTPGGGAVPGQIANPNGTYNLEGQPVGYKTLADLQYVPLEPLTGNFFFEKNVYAANGPPVNSWRNSEFGFRYSSLLPIGNGLQASFIYLYEARDSRFSLCSSCTASFARAAVNGGRGGKGKGAPLAGLHGIFLVPGVFDLAQPAAGVPVLGTVRVPDVTDYRRNHFFGLTGTYYDKDLTDTVFRYDTLYAPKVGVYIANPVTRGSVTSAAFPVTGSSSAWTEMTRFIIAGDRPTYIPWISKQHTFLTYQYVNTWYPDRPRNTAQGVFGTAGKTREVSNFAFVAATNWLVNGQLTSTNALVWDIDNNVGDLGSTNVYRYSRNVLLGLNAIWYIGRSGRFTDPFFQSVNQRMSELEATFTYEI